MKPSLNQFPDWNRPTNGRNQRQCRKCGHTKFEVFQRRHDPSTGQAIPVRLLELRVRC